MNLCVAALLLQLFGNAVVFAQSACSQLPDVPNANLSVSSQKESYQKGDTIGFLCETGYSSGRQIRYVCTNQGWVADHLGQCRLKPCPLPDDIPNGYYQMITGNDFVFGATIKYFCNDGYQMISKEDSRTCLINEWSNHLPVCEPLSCETPTQEPGMAVEGLPDDSPIVPNRVLKFSCTALGSTLNGSEILVCGKDGKWDNPFPNCIAVTCKLPAANPKVLILGAEDGSVTAGNNIKVQCATGGRLWQIECLPTGQWSTTFPSCADTCEMLPVPDGVQLSPFVSQTLVRKGQTLNFQCRIRSHVLRGEARVTCSENGEWSSAFPTCSDYSCGTPPFLENGDTLNTNVRFRHNQRVQYQCQAKYTMQGGGYRTCQFGEWTGEIKCLKPCTVDVFLMAQHNIKFLYGKETKLYAPHDDHITFHCIDGTRHDGVVEMRQKCTDGVMNLPTCVPQHRSPGNNGKTSVTMT